MNDKLESEILETILNLMYNNLLVIENQRNNEWELTYKNHIFKCFLHDMISNIYFNQTKVTLIDKNKDLLKERLEKYVISNTFYHLNKINKSIRSSKIKKFNNE